MERRLLDRFREAVLWKAKFDIREVAPEAVCPRCLVPALFAHGQVFPPLSLPLTCLIAHLRPLYLARSHPPSRPPSLPPSSLFPPPYILVPSPPCLLAFLPPCLLTADDLW